MTLLKSALGKYFNLDHFEEQYQGVHYYRDIYLKRQLGPLRPGFYLSSISVDLNSSYTKIPSDLGLISVIGFIPSYIPAEMFTEEPLSTEGDTGVDIHNIPWIPNPDLLSIRRFVNNSEQRNIPKENEVLTYDEVELGDTDIRFDLTEYLDLRVSVTSN